jgi:hypothetical protein
MMFEKVVFPVTKDGKLTFGRLGSFMLGRSKADIRFLYAVLDFVRVRRGVADIELSASAAAAVGVAGEGGTGARAAAAAS